jgi:hypothetical protein
MKKSLLLILLAAVACSLAPLTGHASQRRPAKTPDNNFADLKLSLETLKGGYLPLEPIPIIITIGNPTDHVVNGHTAIDFSAGYIKLYVSRGDEEPRKIAALTSTISQGLAVSREIEPGEEVTRPQLLTVYLGEVFPERGVYHVEALFYDAPYKQSIRSNKIQIQIRQPKGDEAGALEFIQRNKHKQWFFSGNGFGDESFLQELEQFAAEFKDTAYADYAADLLGEHYYFVGDNQKALTHLQKLEKKADFVYKDEVADRLRQIRMKLTQPQNN